MERFCCNNESECLCLELLVTIFYQTLKLLVTHVAKNLGHTGPDGVQVTFITCKGCKSYSVTNSQQFLIGQNFRENYKIHSMGILTFIIERNRIKNKNKSTRNCKEKTFRHSTFLNLAKQLNAVKLLLNRCDLFTWYIQLRGNHDNKRLSFTPYTYTQRSSKMYKVELLQNGALVCKISKNVHKNTPLQH